MEKDIDPILIAVMQLAEHGVYTTATITVNGTVLSGRVIGQQNYLLKIRKQFNSHVHEENMPGLFDILGLFEEVTVDTEAIFLHLENASVIDGTPPAQRIVGFWRIRISEVDGFSFGK
ncbi:MAG: hypothetical protein AB8G77_27750 [Rhodothermales bacterium]